MKVLSERVHRRVNEIYMSRLSFCSKWFPQCSPLGCPGAKITKKSTKKRAKTAQASPNQTYNPLKDIEIDCLSERRRREVVSPVRHDLSEPSAATELLTAEDVNKDILEIDQFLLDGTMFHDAELNCENFQDLRLWCSTPLPQPAVATEPNKAVTTEDIAGFVTAPPFSAGSGQDYGLQSPLEPTEFFATTPHQLLSTDTAFPYQSPDKGLSLEDELFDIASLPIVFGREDRWDPAADQPAPHLADWANILDNEIHKSYGTQGAFDVEKDYPLPTHLDVVPDATPFTEEVFISEFLLNRGDSKVKIESDILLPYNTNLPYNKMERRKLHLDTKKKIKTDSDIGTPDVLNCVEQLEAETFGLMALHLPTPAIEEQAPSSSDTTLDAACNESTAALERLKEEPVDSEEDTYRHSPAPRRTKRRRRSSDSDETYSPSVETSPPRRKRKTTLSTPPTEPPRKRGRPPKRSPSIASTHTEDNASCVSVEEMRYRELRDKNNEASKRSRMNRKQKEQHMEEMATQLEERNKRLQVKADILEDMTKRLKDALMTAILKK